MRATLCIGVLSLSTLPLLSIALPHKFRKGGGACTTGADCQLNGLCDSGACVCDTAWTGEQCGILHLLPTPPSAHGGRAYPSQANVTSWGGNVLFMHGQYHLYVAEMGGHCGLGSWQHNSFIRHAVSDTITGPYVAQDIVMGAFSHNPEAIRAPDGTIVVFHIGDGTGSKQITDCTNGTTPPNIELAQQSSGSSGSSVLRVATSSHPGGPWGFHNITCHDGPCPLFDNPSAHVLANGTAMLAYIVRNERDKRRFGMSFASAPSLFGPYKPLNGNWSEIHWRPPLGHKCEDPFLWQDKRGGFHVMNHCFQDPPASLVGGHDVGGHVFSEDGFNWHLSTVVPWTDNITHTDGTFTQHYRRQRPKLVLQRGEPTHLLTGLPLQNANHASEWQQWCGSHGQTEPYCDIAETHIQAINTNTVSLFV